MLHYMLRANISRACAKCKFIKKNNLWQGKQRQNQILFLAHFRPQVNVSPCLEEAVRVFVEVLFAGNQ